uniref:G-protein coupled receptors family 1 profile domain-containing protein n=1 Tax=Sphenodon punctatus TaxID=8508 RepID=A0A8D0L1Z2_SPHPU
MAPRWLPLSATVFTLLLLACCWAEECSTERKKSKGRALIRLPACGEAATNATCSRRPLASQLKSSVTTLLLPGLYSVVLVVGLPANALALWVLATKTKKYASTLFLLNLAGADLLFILVLPFKILYHRRGSDWPFGEPACRALVALFYGNMYSSILFLTCISLDRYVSLVHPFAWRGSWHLSSAAGVCMGVWMAVVLGVTPLLLIPQSMHLPELNITTCHDVLDVDIENGYLAYYFPFLSILGFAIPLLLITCSYAGVLAQLFSKGGHYGRVVRILALVLLVFVVCFAPSNALLFIQYLQPQPECHNQFYVWYTLALALAAFNNCLDPFIYFYVCRDFRTRLWDSLFCSKGQDRASDKLMKPLKSSDQSQS